MSIVDIAYKFNGACACPGKAQSIFDAVGFRFDTRPFSYNGKTCIGISTCYVFALNVLRLAGKTLPPWKPGQPIGTLINWAKKHNAWQVADGAKPSPGDVLIIGKNGGTHVAVVVACDDTTLSTIDGGQCCRRTIAGHDGKGRQMIAARSREWHSYSVRGYTVDPVVGWVKSELLP